MRAASEVLARTYGSELTLLTCSGISINVLADDWRGRALGV